MSSHSTSAVFRHLLSRMPSFLGLLGFVFVVFTLFAQLGVALFGGLIKVGSADFPRGAELYAYCNFNDYASAMLTLFELLMVNNWFVIMNATAAASGWWARAYCMAWFCIASVGMTNLVVAQILDSVAVTLRGGVNGGAADEDGPAGGVDSSRSRRPSLAVGQPERQGFNRRHSAAMSAQMAAIAHRAPNAARRRAGACDVDGARGVSEAYSIEDHIVDDLLQPAGTLPVGSGDHHLGGVPDAATERSTAEGWTAAPELPIEPPPTSHETL